MIRRAAGFTIMEVLIAMFVLGIGLLGVAGLQSIALNMNQTSYVRSQATVLARDIADRMRANRAPAVLGNETYPEMEYDMAAQAPSSPSQQGCSGGSSCSPLEMVEDDLFEWTQTIAATLPQGEAFVCRDSTPADGTGAGAPACDGNGERYVIKIWWFEKAQGGKQRFVTEMQP